MEQDAQNRDGSNVHTTFKVVEEERDYVTKKYEADSLDEVFDCGRCRFEDDDSGYSGNGFYSFADAGDFVECDVSTDAARKQPVSFRFLVGKVRNLGRRPSTCTSTAP